jgi:phosphoribosyl-ATP pyrophosphohydrolase
VSQDAPILSRLMAVIQDRKAELPEHSYTTSLFRGGVDRIAAKLREETEELVEAAGVDGADGRQHLVREAADLLYHVLVMLGHRGVGLEEVEAELARRFGVSGLAEKAARPSRRGG